MDKRKVIEAYRRGFLTLQECAQVLGVEKAQIIGLLEYSEAEPKSSTASDDSSLHATYKR
ncbi:hypothetical protein D3C74_95760 [compost metagenome]|nr:hypothetical protein [Fontibacillus solani]